MRKNKTLYRILIIAGFVLINAGILFGISQIIAYLNTGADRAKMLHLDETKDRIYVPEVTWNSLENPGRPMEEANLKRIEEDYLNAWYVKNRALKTGDNAGIFDHFTASARIKVNELIEWNKKTNTTIESTTLSHHLSLEFYSADGTLVVLRDINVSGVERIFKEDQLLLERPFSSDYKIILLLEDGYWRIRHFEKTSVNSVNETASTAILEIDQLEGINYYPQYSPWDTFGRDFSVRTLDEDFKILKDLKLNTIRVFVGYEDFGKAQIDKEKLDKLCLLLNTAHKHNLSVIITLFDFYGNYHMKDWTLTNAHLRGIVTTVKNYPAVIAWDLKNEPDLDFKSRGKQEVLSWLSQTARYLKQLDPTHSITIGWSSPDVALHLHDNIDFISYHYYKPLGGLSTAHQYLLSRTDKPVILQEFGLSSYNGLWNPFGANETDQKSYYEDFYKIQKRDSINYLSWTLYDFGEIPTSVAGRLPWRKNKQAFFGIINTSGEKDKAYDVIKNR